MPGKEVVSQEALLPISSLSLHTKLSERLSHLLRAAGVDEHITAIGHPSELLLDHLPSPESFPAGLRRHMEQWTEDLTSLLEALQTSSEQGRLPTGLKGLTQSYPVLACLDTQPPSKEKRDRSRGLKGLLLLASLLPLVYDCDRTRLQKVIPRAAAHIRLACSEGELSNVRALHLWPKANLRPEYIRCVRDMPMTQPPTDRASEMHREVTQLAWAVSTVVFWQVPREFRPYDGIHHVAPDEEPSEEAFWDGTDGEDDVDAEPTLVVVEGGSTGYAARSSDLSLAARQARWLSGESQAPSRWSTSGVTPIELPRLMDLLRRLDYAVATSLVMALQVATGRPVRDVLSMTIGLGADLTPRGSYCKALPGGSTKGADRAGVPQGITLDLPLPTPLSTRIAEMAVVHASPTTLREVCGVDDDSLITKKIGVMLRERVSGRLEARHLPGVIRGLLHRATNDVVAYLIAGTDAYRPPVGASYYGCNQSELVEQYRSVVEPLFGDRQGGQA